MLLNNKWPNFVVHYEIAFKNRSQWLKMEGLLSGPINILNIHTPNESAKGNKLWEYLKMKLPKDCRWIICGDFNMVEDFFQKLKEMAQEALKIALNIEEPICSNGSFRFYWHNQMRGHDHYLTRLDEVYLVVVQDLDNVIKATTTSFKDMIEV